MEAKLREYRQLKRRKELVEKTKQRITGLFSTKMTNKSDEEECDSLIEIETVPLVEPENELIDEAIHNYETEIIEKPKNIYHYLIIFTIWLVFFVAFVKLEFGAVYFVITLLVGICINTRTRPKRHGEPSAYSVFNQNCESIDGTVRAEELQRNMMFGGLRLF